MSKPPKAPRDKGWDILSQMTQPNQGELKCGHTAPDWNGEGDCITCARDRVLGASDIDRKIDEILELLSAESFDAAINNPDDYMLVLNSSTEKAKQAILALINEAREDEIVRVLQQPYISAHLYGQARIAELKPDTTLEGGK